MAWVGLAADVVSLIVPFATGGGAIVKAATKADDVVDAVKTVNKVDDVVDTGKTLKTARSSAVKKAWKKELDNVKNGGRGLSRDWTDVEIDELLLKGKISGYQEHHMKSIKGYPDLAGDPYNIQFLTR
jgi:hypothetical protein